MTDPSAPPSPFDREKWLHELKREDAHRVHDRANEFFSKLNESSIKSSELALRACLLINGGAAVSVLAFIGGLVSKDMLAPKDIVPVADSLEPFAYGVVASVTAMGLSYFVHYLTGMYISSQQKTWEHPWLASTNFTGLWGFSKTFLHIITSCVAIASIVFFIWGVFSVRNSIVHLPQKPAEMLPKP